MAITPDMARAARAAANRVEQMLLEMLQAPELGEVRVEVTAAGLQVIKRAEKRAKIIKVSQGHVTEVERV
jgi:hypothetical protein